MDQVSSGSSGAQKVVVVSGDVLLEWRFAQSALRNRIDNDGLFDPYNYMEIYFKAVGAMSVGEIIKRSLAGLPAIFPGTPKPRAIVPAHDGFIAKEKIDYTGPYWNSYVICAQYPKNKGTDVVWRVKQKLGIDRKHKDQELTDIVPDDPGNATLVVIEQSNQGFIQNEKAWPRSLREEGPASGWLLLEWTRPSFDKEASFWKRVADKFEGRTVIVVTAEDLRLAGMRISRAQSWERTITDLYAGIGEVLRDPGETPRNMKRSCAHLVVSFGTSGAAVLSADGQNPPRGVLIYDPRYVEGEWATQFEGSMSGFTRCVTAATALEMLRNPETLNTRGILGAIVAARHMLENGFEASGRQSLADTDLPAELRFPAADIARVLRSIICSAGDDDDLIRRTNMTSRKLRLALEALDPSATQDDVEACVRAQLSMEDIDLEEILVQVRRIYVSWSETVRRDRASRTPDEKRNVSDDAWNRIVFVQLVNRIHRYVAPDNAAISAARKFHELFIDAQTTSGDWSILECVLPRGRDGTTKAKKIIETAAAIVEYGDADREWSFPTSHIGRLFITGRAELESLTAVRDLMLDYVRSTTQTPLSIAVFGMPGSGKSFAINELADHLLGDNVLKVEARTFNLSQFSGPEAIASALQQVRDIGLSGKLPLVFWDEFDSTYGKVPLGWLRYFLAPMQDGRFQDESMLRYVGRAIFVFAGGKYNCMNELIRQNKKKKKKKIADDCQPGAHEASRNAKHSDFHAEAKERKVPDFISRLKGFFDVPTLDYHADSGGKRAIIDAATALRRANLLRAFLEREGALEETIPARERDGQGPGVQKHLNVDAGVIEAFLRIQKYKFGARSMEAIVKMSALSGKDRYDRSTLPPDDQLALHVNAAQFFQLVQGRRPRGS